MRDLLCDVINNAGPAKWRYASHAVNDISAPSGIGSLHYYFPALTHSN